MDTIETNKTINIPCQIRLSAGQLDMLKHLALVKSLEQNKQISWAKLARTAIETVYPLSEIIRMPTTTQPTNEVSSDPNGAAEPTNTNETNAIN